MRIDYEFVDDNDPETISVPAKYIVCDACMGTGTRDCWDGGMTGDEMAEQGPEFVEDYLSGMYDKACDECNGNRVLLIVDTEHLPKELRARYEASEDLRAGWLAELAAERRWGF